MRIEWSDAKAERRALQSHEGYHCVFAPREELEFNRVYERPAGTSPPAHTCLIHKITRQPLFFFFTKLVLALFPPPGPTTPPHLTLVMKTFQTLFPPRAAQDRALLGSPRRPRRV